MFPIGHIGYTYGAVALLQTRFPQFTQLQRIDYRAVALVALLPDFIDKPLSLLVFTESHSGQGLAHTLIAHILITAAIFLWKRDWLAYALILNGHLLADQMWTHPHTLFFPFMGWYFEPWRFLGTPRAFTEAYLHILTLPQVWILEVGGAVIMLWFALKNHLYNHTNLLHFVQTGHIRQQQSVSRVSSK